MDRAYYKPMNKNHQETTDAIGAELEATRKAFHRLLASFSESDFRRQGRNPGWTNGEILTHMTFGFIILSALLPMVRLWGASPQMDFQNLRLDAKYLHHTVQLD